MPDTGLKRRLLHMVRIQTSYAFMLQHDVQRTCFGSVADFNMNGYIEPKALMHFIT